MGIQERREREREATRQAIVDSAHRIAVESGWTAVTIRAVAAAVEYSPAVIYQYFASKEAILVALMREGFGLLHEQLGKVRKRRLEPEALVAAVGTAYWKFSLDHPALYQVMHGLAGVPFGTDETPPEARACFEDFLVPITALLESRGGARGREAEEQVELYWAFLHGLVSLNMSNRIQGGTPHASKLSRRLVQEFVRGCVPDAPASAA